MTILEAIQLGIFQGITEFLPISSSGHLVLAQEFMDIPHVSRLLFVIVLHLGTLLSILVVFSKDIRMEILSISIPKTRELILCIGIATLPAAIMGIFFRREIEVLFTNIRMVGIFFIFTGVILLSSRFFPAGSNVLNIRRAVIIGVSQSIALLPGISRSGLTISSGLMVGLKPQHAAKFSFFLAIPAILGSGFLMFWDLANEGLSSESLTVLLSGLITSFLVGILALKVLLSLLNKGKFHWFGVYCILIGIIVLRV